MLIERGQPLPDWVDEEPELLPGGGWLLKAFWELSTERYFDLGPIPVSRITDYGERFGLEPTTISPFTHIIRVLDEAYRDWIIKERKRLREADG